MWHVVGTSDFCLYPGQLRKCTEASQALVDVGALASHCACCACCRAAEGNPAGALLYSAVRSYRSCDRAFARSAPFTNCPCRLPADTTDRHHKPAPR